MSEVTVNWYEDKVKLALDKSYRGTADKVALRIEERTKINISEAPGASGQGLIDTGFMLNSVYSVTPDQSNYGQANQSGEYTDRAGNTVRRNIAPEEELPSDADALVAVGADYAIYQEIIHGFLFRAAEDTGKELGGLIETF